MAEPVRRSRRLDATVEQAAAERPATANAAAVATTPGGAPEQDQPANTAEAAEVALEASVYGESISQCK